MMVSSRTFMGRSANLLADKGLASVVVRLMMAMNYLGVANSALAEWDQTKDRKKDARRHGGKLYYGRMLMAHVYEALHIIEEIKNSTHLKATVNRCDSKTRASFDAVAKFLHTNDYKVLGRIRNKSSFHYDPKLTVRALEKLVEKYPDHRFPYSLGQDILDWYFELGDLINDKIVVRYIFEVPDEVPDQANVRTVQTEIDSILHRLHTMAVAFTDFAGHFIWHCMKKW
jgi:hypothetical protein